MPNKKSMNLLETGAVTLFLGGIILVYLLEILLIAFFVFNLATSGRHISFFWSWPALAVHSPAMLGLLCFAYGLFIEPYWLEVKKIPVRTGKLSKTHLRIVQISDLHCDKKPRNEDKLIKIVNLMKADVIVFNGDCLMLNTPQALPLFKQTLKSLNASIAKFAVRGNVDLWYMPGLDYFSDTGFEVLDKKTTTIKKDGETLYVSGLSLEYLRMLAEALKDVPENHFSIFLCHNSDFIEDLDRFNVDLYLCGHTHGGQVRLPFFGALTTLSKFGKKYEAGLYKLGKTTLYVNRGIGLEGGRAPRVRFLARPEIAVFDVMPTQ